MSRIGQRNNRLKYADYRPSKVVMMAERLIVKYLGKWYETQQPNRLQRIKINNHFKKIML
jgi:hypothetical protein